MKKVLESLPEKERKELDALPGEERKKRIGILMRKAYAAEKKGVVKELERLLSLDPKKLQEILRKTIPGHRKPGRHGPRRQGR